MANRHQRPLRVLLAKAGLDGHDIGARQLARAMRDAGIEVIYTGLHQTPDAIAECALQEDADIVGLSLLSGAHVPLTRKVLRALQERGCHVPLLVGGLIPDADVQFLKQLGATEVFPSRTATVEGVIDYLHRLQAHL
ncbi:MAG: cobalamin B12-binding domain-containing protein [Candidatus Binatia bacterium]